MSAYLNISRDKYFIGQNAQFQGDQTEDMMKKKKKIQHHLLRLTNGGDDFWPHRH